MPRALTEQEVRAYELSLTTPAPEDYSDYSDDTFDDDDQDGQHPQHTCNTAQLSHQYSPPADSLAVPPLPALAPDAAQEQGGERCGQGWLQKDLFVQRSGDDALPTTRTSGSSRRGSAASLGSQSCCVLAGDVEGEVTVVEEGHSNGVWRCVVVVYWGYAVGG